MAMPEPAVITGYHAHIYFEESSADHAAEIRETIAARFDVEMGRWHDKLVGPHSRPMYQVSFAPSLFAEFVLHWLRCRGDV